MNVQIVSFRCVLKNQLGQMISTSFNQDVTTSLSSLDSTGPLPGLIEALKGLQPGEKGRVYVPAEKAYGLYLTELSVRVARSRLKNGTQLKVNDQVMGRLRKDTQHRSFRVTEASSCHVVLDGNHPLAGQDLVFDVELTSSRLEQDVDSTPDQRYC